MKKLCNFVFLEGDLTCQSCAHSWPYRGKNFWKIFQSKNSSFSLFHLFMSSNGLIFYNQCTVKKYFRKLEQQLHGYGNTLNVYQQFEAIIPQLFEFDVHNKIHYEYTTYEETFVNVFWLLNICYNALQILSIA